MNKEIVVVGGGPAGIEAAREAARLGLGVTLVSAEKIGGRANWHSLLPSKMWLAAAGTAQEFAALSGGEALSLAPQEVLTRMAVEKVFYSESTVSDLQDRGVSLVYGSASFEPPNNVQVRDGEGTLCASFSDVPVIVASGSIPLFPPGLRPDGKRVIAPRMLSKMAVLPATILVIGAGATGCEAAYMFNALGAEVTWIVDQFGILPQFHQKVGAALGEALRRQGVRISAGQMVADLERHEDRVTAVLVEGTRIEAEMAFVAVGRRPDRNGLNLPAVGVQPGEDGRIHVDAYGRSENPLLYLVGDVDGGIMTANKAQAQGRIAARHIAGAPAVPWDPDTLVLPVYSDPQVAQVGDVSGGPGTAARSVPFERSLKSRIMGHREGYLELFYDEKDGRILGATAVGPHAADVLSPVAVAIGLRGRLDDLAAIYGAYPSLSELPFIAVRETG